VSLLDCGNESFTVRDAWRNARQDKVTARRGVFFELVIPLDVTNGANAAIKIPNTNRCETRQKLTQLDLDGTSTWTRRSQDDMIVLLIVVDWISPLMREASYLCPILALALQL
jgi:hypothetical protein